MSTRTNRAVALAWAAVVAGSGLIGCASSPREAAKAEAVTQTALGLSKEAPPGSTMTARDAYPFIALTAGEPVPGVERRSESGALVSRWEVLDGEHAGKVIREERTAEGDNIWRVRSVIEGEEKAIDEQVLRYDESTGSVVLADLRQIDRGVRVEMRPSPSAMPAQLERGEVVTQKFAVRMPYLDNPRRLRAQGHGEMTLEYAADQSLRVSGKPVDARRVKEVFTTNVTAANAVRTIERWFVPGTGRVAERWDEEVKILGLISERTSQTVRLLPP